MILLHKVGGDEICQKWLEMGDGKFLEMGGSQEWGDWFNDPYIAYPPFL